jgi:hypothetical protein
LLSVACVRARKRSLEETRVLDRQEVIVVKDIAGVECGGTSGTTNLNIVEMDFQLQYALQSLHLVFRVKHFALL